MAYTLHAEERGEELEEPEIGSAGSSRYADPKHLKYAHSNLSGSTLNSSAAVRTVPHCKITFDQQRAHCTSKPASLLSPKCNTRRESDILLIDVIRKMSAQGGLRDLHAPPRQTLEHLRRSTPWCRVCEQCLHHWPVAFVPLVIPWGPDA
jgi:hypothetical protein